MSTTNGIQKRLKVTDPHGNVWIMTMIDAEARQAIDEGKFMDFDPDYFTSQLSQDQKELKIGLNGVPIGVDSDSPLKFVQDDAQGIVIGSDAPFAESIAPNFSTSGTYAVGDAVMYNGKRYVSNEDQTMVAWDNTKWTEKSVEDEIGNIETLLAAL